MSQPIDNLEGITGVKLSDMLGKEEVCQKCKENTHDECVNCEEKSHYAVCEKCAELGDENRISDEHKDECNGCALCEL